MILLRRVIGDALRARRQGQHRTLREVSSAANVSLGYLSEIERGQKEASSELLAAICDALGAQLSELLREVTDTVALSERMTGVLPALDSPATRGPAVAGPSRRALATAVPTAARGQAADAELRRVATDGSVTVSVHQEAPLKATLRTARRVHPPQPDRDVVCAA